MLQNTIKHSGQDPAGKAKSGKKKISRGQKKSSAMQYNLLSSIL